MEREQERAVALLRDAGIEPGGYFAFSGSPERCCHLTLSGRVLGPDGREIPLTENEIWERFGELCPRTREDFLRAKAGLPGALREASPEEIEELAERFWEEYHSRREEGGWHFLCSYGEETIRRVAAAAVEKGFKGPDVPPKRRKREQEKVLKEVFMARVLQRLGLPGEKGGR